MMQRHPLFVAVPRLPCKRAVEPVLHQTRHRQLIAGGTPLLAAAVDAAPVRSSLHLATPFHACLALLAGRACFQGRGRGARFKSTSTYPTCRAATATAPHGVAPPAIHWKEQDQDIVLVGPEAELESSATYVLFAAAPPAKKKDGDGEAAAVATLIEDLPKRFTKEGELPLGDIDGLMEREKFKGGAGSTQAASLMPGAPAERIVIVGVGPSDKDPDWQLAGATAAAAVDSLRGSTVHVLLPEGVDASRLLMGMLPRLHVDMNFKGTNTKEEEREKKGPSCIKLISKTFADESSLKSASAAVEEAKVISSSVCLARELVNATANHMTPTALAKVAEEIAELSSSMSIKVMDAEECKAMGMGCYLGVAAASNEPPKFIHLTYKPEGEVTKKIGIVGKGLTFDSGGYTMKVGAGSLIDIMKIDMGGAAATLGTAAAVAKLQPKGVEVHFIVASCENMVSGNQGALHPGDVIIAMDGTTVEVNNTDAEGRLTLADALLYAQEQGVEEVIDIATLTGACIVSLGQEVGGIWSTCDDFTERLQKSAKTQSEKVWRMPLEDSYYDGLKSELADTYNFSPGRWGGAITAALFLKKFIKNDRPWIHLDIAGPVWAEKPKGMNRKGGTGYMVKTLTDLVRTS